MELVLHTGEGPKLINKVFVTTTWHQYIRPIKDLGLVGETKQAVLMGVVIILHVRMGDLRVRVWSGVVKTLAVNVLLGTTFTEFFSN